MEEELSLNELFVILKNRIALIVSLSIVGLLLTALYTFFIVTPMFESTTQLLVNHRQDENIGLQLNDINTNVRMIDTYKDIIKGPVILDDVKEHLGTDLNTAQLSNMIKITANANSQVFSLTITSADPMEAANIANEIATTFQNNIGEIMNVENVSIISKATVKLSPVSPNIPMNLAIGLVLGLMIGIGVAFLQSYLDNTIKDSQFINENIGWTDLGSISMMTEKEKKEVAKATRPELAVNGRRRV